MNSSKQVSSMICKTNEKRLGFQLIFPVRSDMIDSPVFIQIEIKYLKVETLVYHRTAQTKW